MSMLDVVAWVHIAGGRMLAVRARGRDLLYLPGGKREAGEADWAAISREVREELSVELDPRTFRRLGVVHAPAHDQPEHTHVRMSCFTAAFHGRIHPSGEIDELRFVSVNERELLAPAARAALDLAADSGLLG